MIRVFSHYIPINLFVLFILEAIAIATSVFLGAAIRFYDIDGKYFQFPEEFFIWQPLSFSLVMMVIMTMFGLYGADQPQGVKDMSVRILIAFVVGLGVMSLVFYIFPDV